MLIFSDASAVWYGNYIQKFTVQTAQFATLIIYNGLYEKNVQASSHSRNWYREK